MVSPLLNIGSLQTKKKKSKDNFGNRERDIMCISEHLSQAGVYSTSICYRSFLSGVRFIRLLLLSRTCDAVTQFAQNKNRIVPYISSKP